MPSLLLRALLFAIGQLPLGVLHGLASVVGNLFWWIPNERKRVALLHLDLCLPELSEAERREIARQSLIHLAKALVEAPAIWFGPHKRLRRWIDDVQAAAKLREIISGGGSIVLCPHIGSWELAGMFCAAQGTITSLYKPQKGVIDALILEGRRRLGAHLVPTTGAAVRALLQALRDGQMIGVLPDQDPPRGAGVFAPLFGIPAHTTELVSKLAARTQAPVCFCYAERLPWARGFRFHVVPLVNPDIADSEMGAAAMNRGIESVLTHLPEQYWWSYERFRRLPRGIKSPYR
ncbi:MAG: lysophospholipid acyltransferase family protein [Panacagrimonas sp.]